MGWRDIQYVTRRKVAHLRGLWVSKTSAPLPMCVGAQERLGLNFHRNFAPNVLCDILAISYLWHLEFQLVELEAIFALKNTATSLGFVKLILAGQKYLSLLLFVWNTDSIIHKCFCSYKYQEHLLLVHIIASPLHYGADKSPLHVHCMLNMSVCFAHRACIYQKLPSVIGHQKASPSWVQTRHNAQWQSGDFH